MTWWYGADTDGVVQDPAGNAQNGITLLAYTERTGGTQVTTLVDAAEAPLASGSIPVVNGRVDFGDPTETYMRLWLVPSDNPSADRWQITTRSLADIVANLAPAIGTVTSVNGVTPTAGNVVLTPDDIGALDLADADARYPQLTQTIPRIVQGIALTQMIWGGTSGSGFSNVGSGLCTVVEDTVDFVLGDRSWSVTTDGAIAQGAVGDYVLAAPVDMTDKIPVIWLKFPTLLDMQRVVDFKFYIGSNNFSNIGYWNLLENANAWPYVQPGEWIPITLPRGTFVTAGGTIDWANIDSVQFVGFDNGAGPITFKWGGWGLTTSPKVANPTGVVSICVDDGHGTARTKIAPYLDKYGFRATMYMIGEILQNPGSFPTYLTIAQTRVLQDLHQWAIGSHAFDVELSNTGYTDYPSATQLADMFAIRGYLNSLGFHAADHLALPLGKYDSTVLANARQVFRSVRHLTHVPGWETIPAANNLKLRAVSPTAVTPLSTMQAWVDQAVNGGEWLIIVLHEIVDSSAAGTQILTADFQALIDYIAASGAAVKTVPEAIDAGAQAASLNTALAGYVRLPGGNTFDLPNSVGEPWMRLRVPNDLSDSTTWPNRIEVWYFDTTLADYRLGWYINEKGLLRTRGTTPSDVPARIMGHPAQSSTVALQEWTPDDNTVKLIQFLLSQAVFNVPIIVPYIVNPLGERLYWGTGNPYEHAAYANYRPDLGSGWIDYNDA